MNNYVIETRNLTKQYETQKKCCGLEYSCKKGTYLWFIGEKWSR